MPSHQARLNATRQHFWGDLPEVDLASFIQPQGKADRMRCRVTYARQILRVEYFPYHVRPVRRLRLVEADGLDYRYKYADRTALDSLVAQRGEADDILIVQNGLLTDTSYTNIALWNGKEWVTPARPLLEGTKRKLLLAQGVLVPKDIPASEISAYSRICLFNALLHWGEVVLPCEQIVR